VAIRSRLVREAGAEALFASHFNPGFTGRRQTPPLSSHGHPCFDQAKRINCSSYKFAYNVAVQLFASATLTIVRGARRQRWDPKEFAGSLTLL
jgi:hypothetical protein